MTPTDNTKILKANIFVCKEFCLSAFKEFGSLKALYITRYIFLLVVGGANAKRRKFLSFQF